MAGGDRDAELADGLERWFRHMRAPLVGWFRRRVGDLNESEDLAQECFLRVTQRREDHAVENFEGYLYRTAKSVLADRRRRRGVRQAEAHIPLRPDDDEGQEANALRVLL